MNNQYPFGTYGYIALKRLRSAEKNLNTDADVVAYASHQAIANILKQYIIITYFKPDIKDVLHTSKLSILVANSGIELPSKYKSDITQLDNYYSNCRYPSPLYKDIELKAAQNLFQSAKEIVAIVNNRIILNDIAHLKKNWNNNNANPFPASLIEKCITLISQLEVQPFISPTACGAIQMEYEKENGDYLELEIYPERIEVYQVINNIEYEEILTSLNEVKQTITNFLTNSISKD